MERDKSRGLKHIHNKKRDKPKTKSALVTVVPKTKPKKLDSNWDRYEEEESTSFQLGLSTDFAVLANNPAIKGSHFQFKSDKYDLETAQELHGDIFNLDLNLLNLSMSTIPYYEFFNDKNLFSEKQKEIMVRSASDNLELYNIYLDKVVVNLICDDKVGNADKPDIQKKLQNLDLQEENKLILPEVIDDIPPTTKPSTSIRKDSEDLETWLDDILDE